MAKLKKILAKVLAGSKNIAFNDFYFTGRKLWVSPLATNGSHQIFVHPKVKELVNLQNVAGQVKPYQIRQFMEVVERYALNLENE